MILSTILKDSDYRLVQFSEKRVKTLEKQIAEYKKAKFLLK
jgi:hypothetical protein